MDYGGALIYTSYDELIIPPSLITTGMYPLDPLPMFDWCSLSKFPLHVMQDPLMAGSLVIDW